MGRKNAPAYGTWVQFRQRCRDKNAKDYPRYGGRGITFDPAWNDYEVFWADMGPTWKPGMTLERIDNDGPYCKSNCRWATPLEQGANKRNNVWVDTPHGRMTIAQTSRVFGVHKATLLWRHRNGRPLLA